MFETLRPVFESFKDTKDVEMEIRLGRVNRGAFDTNVGKDVFDSVLQGLKVYTQWEKSLETEAEIFYKGDKRMLFIGDSDEAHGAIQKKKLKKIDCVLEGRPLDVRFGVATEKVVGIFDPNDSDRQKNRKRWSFIRKNLSIDMSIVSDGGAFDPDAEDDTCYQIELEIINPKLVKDVDTMYNLFWKVEDILKLLPPSK